MDWDEDALEYGYVMCRLPDGDWWHGHFGRSAMEYACELLGRRTSVLLCLQWLGRGGVQKSSQHFLTLDGDCVPQSHSGLAFDSKWGTFPKDAELLIEAQHFQHEIMPLLYESERLQTAIRDIIHQNAAKNPPYPGRDGEG